MFAEAGGGEPQPLTRYEPGKTYDVTLAVGFTSAAPAGYGFQAQILTATGAPATSGALSASGAVQISSGPADRRYAEQSEISDSGDFQFSWTAPEAGAGAVDLYAVGNLVNRGQGSRGDNGSSSPTIVTLSEGIVNSVRELPELTGNLFPNPVVDGGDVSVEIAVKSAGDYRVSITAISGRAHQRGVHYLSAGLRRLELSTSDLAPGVYLVAVTGGEGSFVRRLVVD